MPISTTRTGCSGDQRPGSKTGATRGAMRASSRVKRALGQRLARSAKASSTLISASAKPSPEMPYSVAVTTARPKGDGATPQTMSIPAPPARNTPGGIAS
ncbi:hypothetical protein D3C87_1927450 [compost metagenome]